MTDLGDDTDGVATAFLVVNIVVGVLLGVLAWAVHDAFREWFLTGALILAAGGSVIFGVTACERRCRRPLCAGRAPGWLHAVHLVVAAAVALAIVAAPFLTWFFLEDRSDAVDLFRTVGLGVGATAAVLFVLLLRRVRARKRDADRGSADVAHVGLCERLLWTVGYGWVVMLACTLVRPGWPAVAALAAWLALALSYVLRPGWRDPTPRFSEADCQPNTLTPFKARCGLFRVYTIVDAGDFGRELGAALHRRLVAVAPDGDTTTGGADGERSAVTVAVTARGLEQLGIRYRWRARYVDDAFGEGMCARARALGDVGPSNPATWDVGWRRPKLLHVALWVQAPNEEALEARDREVRCHFASLCPRVSVRTDVQGRPGARTEHFGFVDGASQPWVEGIQGPDDLHVRGGGKLRSSVPKSDDTDRATATADGRESRRRARRGTRKERRRWQPIALGEFVVGQVDETGDVFPVPSPPEVFLGGTFMAVRKLRQDVAGFRRYAGPDRGPGSLASRLVGRTSDGTPLMPSSPRGATADGEAKAGVGNAFTYGNDPEGLLCPLGAHIRRANPRDALGFGTTLTERRRIIRRAMPYGTPWGDGQGDDDRGLLFVACNVRISEQFEFVQQLWLNRGSPFGLGDIPDPLGGGWNPSSPRALVVGGRPPDVRGSLPSFVTTAGGEYFFAPSIPGLRALAASAARTVRPAGRRTG